MGTTVKRELPEYVCHKKVRALKIKAVNALNGNTTIVPEDERYAPFNVDADYVNKHRPIAGGYYVVYKDGYKSFSPAEAFEDGYTLSSEGSCKKHRYERWVIVQPNSELLKEVRRCVECGKSQVRFVEGVDGNQNAD